MDMELSRRSGYFLALCSVQKSRLREIFACTAGEIEGWKVLLTFDYDRRLQNNSLTGSIPDWLGSMPNLQEL